jgi:hypothetical protein
VGGGSEEIEVGVVELGVVEVEEVVTGGLGDSRGVVLLLLLVGTATNVDDGMEAETEEEGDGDGITVGDSLGGVIILDEGAIADEEKLSTDVVNTLVSMTVTVTISIIISAMVVSITSADWEGVGSIL